MNVGNLDKLIYIYNKFANNKDVKCKLITDDVIRTIEQELKILRENRGISLSVEEMLDKNKTYYSIEEKEDMDMSKIFLSNPTRTGIKKIINTLEKEIIKYENDNDKERIYIKFLTRYKDNYTKEISSYFYNRLIQSFKNNIKDQAIIDNLTNLLKENYKINDNDEDENSLK